MKSSALQNKALLLKELQEALRRLDQRLKEAIAAADQLYGPEAAADPNRGLYISGDEIQQLLKREVGQPLFPVDALGIDAAGSRFIALQERFQLSLFDLDVLLVALAPEIDLRYERLYAYLQDDVTRKSPTVDLALNLLCQSLPDKLEKRHRLTVSGPLIEHRLIQTVPPTAQADASFLSHALAVDRRIVQFLLGDDGLDLQLKPFCQLEQAPTPPAQLPMAMSESWMAGLALSDGDLLPLRLYLQGVPGIGKQGVAAAIAAHLQAPLLKANLAQVGGSLSEITDKLTLVQREAQLHRAVLYLSGVDALVQTEAQTSRWVTDLLNQFGGVVVLAGHQPWAKFNILCPDLVWVPLMLPDAAERRLYWQNALDAVGVVLSPPEVDRLAEQFRLTPEQIEGAVREALRPTMVLAATSREALTLVDLMAAARQQSGQELAALAQKLTPKYQWQDVVLPVDQTAQLREICHQARYREQVYGAWGFGDKLSRGKGLAMLFAGPPGTGKTMAAEVMANELQLDLYRIDLSQVVSKYIGETEKNLDRIFMAAQTANAILFFDEADALFGKRSDVKDAHDRYANIEVGYLLQKMEDYEGITILASNLRQNMDDAFVRRIQMIVEFPFPDEESRHRIWQVTFPPAVPLAEDVDLAVLAREVKLPGGNIKNIALAAAFTAASAGGDMHMEHLIKAAQREHQKLGRRWSLS